MAPNETPHTKLCYSIAEACRATSLGRTTLYKYIRSGDLSVVHIGGRTVIPAANLEEFIRKAA